MTTPTPAELLRAQAAALEAKATQLETTQLTRADLAGMTPDEINQARIGGQLNTLLGYKKEKN